MIDTKKEKEKVMATQPLVIVQNNHVVPLTGPVAKAARARGLRLHDISSGYMDGVPALPAGGPHAPVLIIGSVLFVHQWARGQADLLQWVFWDDAQYDAVLWADKLGRSYLNAAGYETTIGAFQASNSEAMHLRPRSGVKMIGDKPLTESSEGRTSIAGIVVTPAEIAALNVDPDTGIWASPPREIEAEVRVWMIGGVPVAASTYRIDGEHDRRSDHPFVNQASQKAAALHGTWHPGRHYVVDLALTSEGWLVVEYNPIHSSGWYDADPGTIIDAYMAYEAAGS